MGFQTSPTDLSGPSPMDAWRMMTPRALTRASLSPTTTPTGNKTHMRRPRSAPVQAAHRLVVVVVVVALAMRLVKAAAAFQTTSPGPGAWVHICRQAPSPCLFFPFPWPTPLLHVPAYPQRPSAWRSSCTAASASSASRARASPPSRASRITAGRRAPTPAGTSPWCTTSSSARSTTGLATGHGA